MKTLLIISVFCLAVTFNVSGQATPQEMLNKAIYEEEVNGNLEEAIKLFLEIVEKNSTNRTVTAETFYHLGLTNEKLGNKKAKEYYEKVVNNFADQPKFVRIAKERLSKLQIAEKIAEETPKVMTSKKIWEGNEVDNLGKISPDGKYISYVDWPAGDLAIYEIATEKKRRLTSYNFGETWSTDPKTTYVLSSIWSADSRQNIYSTGTGEIRTIGLENSTPRTIRERETKNEWVVQVYDISGDGKTILGTIETMDRKTQIILVSVRDGEKQIIKELSGIRIVGKLKFTNDGAGIVYDYPPDLDSPVHDIYWLSLDGKTETPIIKHPAHDFVLDLSPDGNQLLFASSRSGKMGFYYVGLKNGKTQGNPKFIKTSEYPNLTGLGFSDNGVFYCFYQPFVTDVYETEINSETSAIVSHPNEIIGSFMGENSAPDYSSDGKYLAFISRRPPFFTRENGPPTGNVLCIKSLENGTLREIKPDIEDFGIPKWSPDNSSILMMNTNTERTTEIYKIDLQSEKLSLIFSDKNKKIFDFEWCADGMSIFMVLQYQENDTTKHKLVRYNLETKEEKILFVNHGRKGYFPDLATISCSPDGNWIAFLGLDQKKTIKIIPTSGGEVREIYSLDQKKTIDGKQIWSSKSYANSFIHHCWSADGKYIYLQKFREPRGDGIWNLWQLPVNGGNPVNLGLEMTDIWQISAHPDGRKLVYSNQGSSYKLPQIWMMENFLPKDDLSVNKNE
ncbi:MAG: PD40 domain-containing protein [Mariniphaga sp.]|nr:PD40 domain-containing protein [Mariniphaga sp.]